MGVNLKDARAEVEKIIGRGSGFVAVEIPFTPRAKRVLELSWDEARQLGHNYIGTEHLLLGLIREGEGVAARVLENLGVDLNKVRSNVIKMLGESKPQATTGGGSSSSTSSSSTGGKTKTPSLDEFGRDLTLAAQELRLDPVVGREKEIERVIQILARRTKITLFYWVNLGLVRLQSQKDLQLELLMQKFLIFWTVKSYPVRYGTFGCRYKISW